MTLMNYSDLEIQHLSLKIIGQLSLSPHFKRKPSFGLDLLENIRTILQDAEVETSLDCCWILGNITIDNPGVVEEVIELDMLGSLLNILRVHPQVGVRVEACRAICNIAKCARESAAVYEAIMESSAVHDLVDFLNTIAKTKQSDDTVQIIRLILATLVLIRLYPQEEGQLANQIKGGGGINLNEYARAIFV
jgi:hypothetical protein